MGERKKLVLDTSTLMNVADELENNIDEFQYIIPSIVADELDNLKESQNINKSSKARKGLRFIEKYEDRIKFIISDFASDQLPHHFNRELNDNKIISISFDNNCALSTYDRGMRIKADSIGIEVVTFDKVDNEYKGYRTLLLDMNDKNDEEKLSNFYQKPEDNSLNMHVNEYLLIKDKNLPIRDEDYEIIDYRLIDTLRWDGVNFVEINKKPLKSIMFGNIKPLDEYQHIAIDSMINNQITMIRGHGGSGKTLLSLAYAVQEIEKNNYHRLVVYCNPVPVKNATKQGFLPGDLNEKLLGECGEMIADKFGDIIAVESWIMQGKLELLPFSKMRGRDFSTLDKKTGKKTIVWVQESQNLDVEMLKLGIQRLGEDTKMIIDGDNLTQIDSYVFEGNNNGMKRVSDVFKDEDCFGEVLLKNIHRSKVAEIADRM